MAATTHLLILASAPVRPRGVLAHIRELLQESSSGKQAKLELLYRASRDGWRGQDFHSRCDNKGATVTVIKCTGGFVFGGYADRPWHYDGYSTHLRVTHTKAFLSGIANFQSFWPLMSSQ